jgi:putative FmdB family regulatory protein
MPIYEYKCKQCGTEIEVRQSVSDEPLTSCEKCHGQLEKQWSLSGFQFKGAGWYVTDYAGGKKPPTESTSTETSASKTSTAAASTESAAVEKPSSKAE